MSDNTQDELLKKLIGDDDDELEKVELQKEESPKVVTGGGVRGTYSKKQKKGSGGCPCWCKCVGITMLTFTLLGMAVMAYACSVLKDVVEHLTVETDSPQKFPIVEMSDAELEKVADRVASFVDDILDEESDIVDDLVLTQDEINGFLGHSDYLRGNAVVSLHEDRIVEEYSLPMDVLGFRDRYFVGNDYLTVGDNNVLEMKMETEATHEDWFDGPLFFAQLQYLVTKSKEDEGQTILELFLQEGSFFGRVAPQEFIDRRENLLEGLYDADDDDVETIRDVIDGIELVSIQEGKVVVKARRQSLDRGYN